MTLDDAIVPKDDRSQLGTGPPVSWLVSMASLRAAARARLADRPRPAYLTFLRVDRSGPVDGPGHDRIPRGGRCVCIEAEALDTPTVVRHATWRASVQER